MKESKLFLERGRYRLFGVYDVENQVVELSHLKNIHIDRAALTLSSRLIKLVLEEETTLSFKTGKNHVHGEWGPDDAASAYTAMDLLLQSRSE